MQELEQVSLAFYALTVDNVDNENVKLCAYY